MCRARSSAERSRFFTHTHTGEPASHFDAVPVGLLRALYLEIAKHTGQELAQGSLTQWLNASAFSTNQPTIGKYMHYLADALLIREFRRYPLAKSSSSRVPAKITLSDLGVGKRDPEKRSLAMGE
jgi:predicted AAA+ superfamily ATPase